MEKKENQMQKDEENDKQPKILKQFVIVKEYNGSFSPTKKCKREYTQKCILKEKLSKSERNSLENYLDKELKKPDTKIEDEKIKNANKNELKYVTLIDLPENSYQIEREIEEREKTVEKVERPIYFTETLKKNAMYTLLAAGGLFGAYTLFKNTSD